MCGAIVLAYSTQGISREAPVGSAIVAHLTYNSGRVLSYTIFGAIFGSMGGGISSLHRFGFWFSLAAGALLVLSGMLLLRIFPRVSFPSELNFGAETKNLLFRIYRATFAALIARHKLEPKFYIGLLTPLLPCGLLYSMFLKAASTASPVDGALTMFLFGLGIVPALVITGLVSQFFGNRLRAWGDKLAAVTIILMGVVVLARAAGVDIPFVSSHHQ